MTNANKSLEVSDFTAFLHETKRYQQYTKLISRVAESQGDHFTRYGNILLNWAAKSLGEDALAVLSEGYARFVQDVTRSQIVYEQSGAYKHSSYKDVYDNTYNNPEFMNHYHWGVYVTTFAWPHHLDICRFYHERFLTKLSMDGDAKQCLDLGCGSGVWSMLLLNDRKNWSSQGVDISETSIGHAQDMAMAAGYSERFNANKKDALTFKGGELYDAAVSCFLLEHLEQPHLLLENISAQLKPRSFAFISGALTAAETDHITEFKYESDLVSMAENAGLRVVEFLSAAPPIDIEDKRNYLPRSAAFIVQKKGNDIW